MELKSLWPVGAPRLVSLFDSVVCADIVWFGGITFGACVENSVECSLRWFLASLDIIKHLVLLLRFIVGCLIVRRRCFEMSRGSLAVIIERLSMGGRNSQEIIKSCPEGY
jgi:hypothetical protein